MEKKKILIVEDERIVAEDIRTKLEYVGYVVAGIASSGEEALKKTEKLQPDLVLMDIVLEGKMDGIEAAAQILSRFNIPVVYLTAYSDERTLKKAKATEKNPATHFEREGKPPKASTAAAAALTGVKIKKTGRIKDTKPAVLSFIPHSKHPVSDVTEGAGGTCKFNSLFILTYS